MVPHLRFVFHECILFVVMVMAFCNGHLRTKFIVIVVSFCKMVQPERHSSVKVEFPTLSGFLCRG